VRSISSHPTENHISHCLFRSRSHILGLTVIDYYHKIVSGRLGSVLARFSDRKKIKIIWEVCALRARSEYLSLQDLANNAGSLGRWRPHARKEEIASGLLVMSAPTVDNDDDWPARITLLSSANCTSTSVPPAVALCQPGAKHVTVGPQAVERSNHHFKQSLFSTTSASKIIA
jgi:hypothetical protein